MADPVVLLDTTPDDTDLIENLRRARAWAWDIHDQRVPGVARNLAWAMIGLASDHDPEPYGPWSKAKALEPSQLVAALSLMTDIARLVRKADELQPNLVRGGEVGQ